MYNITKHLTTKVFSKVLSPLAPECLELVHDSVMDAPLLLFEYAYCFLKGIPNRLSFSSSFGSFWNILVKHLPKNAFVMRHASQ